jgi:hypothetical protein
VRSRQRLHEADEQGVDDVIVAERVERQGIVEVLSEELKRDHFVIHDPGDVRFVQPDDDGTAGDEGEPCGDQLLTPTVP